MFRPMNLSPSRYIWLVRARYASRLGPQPGSMTSHSSMRRLSDAAAIVTGAVGKVNAVAGVDLHQREVVLEPAADVAEELLPVLRHHHQRRAGIEGEALRLPPAGAATGLVMLFQHRHIPAGMGQTHRGGETADAGTHHRGTAAAPGRLERRRQWYRGARTAREEQRRQS